MNPCIVLDKSYLMACSKERMAITCGQYSILLAQSLAYELIKGTPEARATQFSKFPASSPPRYVTNIGQFLADELKYHKPYGRPSEKIQERDYSNNKLFADKNYILDDTIREALENQKSEVDIDTKHMLDDMEKIRQDFLRNLPRGDDERKLKRVELENKIANDRLFIEKQYNLIEIDQNPSNGFSKIPFELMNTDWATYRWFQVQNLFALDLCFRYPSTSTILDSEKATEKVRHDILDAKYLITALLEGGFAVKEKKLIEWWKLLNPSGILLTDIE